MSRRFLCGTEDCPKQGMKAFDAEGGPRVLVASTDERFYGYQAICPHMEVALEEGFYDGKLITCHQHLWQWDVKTGAPIGLAEAPLQRYELVEEAGALYVVESSPLSQTELFAGVGDATLQKIAGLARRETFETGAVMYRPGDPADDLCVLASGRVQFGMGRDDHTSPAGFSLRVGEVFGWAALLDDQPRRIATATCLEPSTVLMINGRELLTALESDPAAGFLVMRRLASLITHHMTPQGAR